MRTMKLKRQHSNPHALINLPPPPPKVTHLGRVELRTEGEELYFQRCRHQDVQGARLPEPRKIPLLVAAITALFRTESLNLRINNPHELPPIVNALVLNNIF